MSVLVKGMKMPDSCAVCRFAGKGGYHMERVVCMFTGKNEDAENVDRLSDCPLISLPDKHGRLIDAGEIPWNHGANGDVVVYPDTIAEMPTIVESEDES